jgi:hypothetical protein
MDGCMDAWMDGWMHGCMDACMHAWMDGWMYGCMYVFMFVCLHSSNICVYTYVHPGVKYIYIQMNIRLISVV